MPTSYDEVLYPNLPLLQTHPDRLATLASLFGMDPAPPRRCRVLEIGCGGGENLIPMAFHYPASEFLGIDAAAVATAAGREIATLGLRNIRIEQRDILDSSPPPGVFDYIIAHGFYSWVPEPVRDRLMAIVQAGLAPQGVAYISYNALPGGRLRQMFRDMMLFHLNGATDPAARIQGAREIVQWFMASRSGEAESGAVGAQAESILERPAACLFHDELGDTYHPVYFHEFLAHAARFGLQFLSEAACSDLNPGSIPAHVVAQVDRVSAGDRILRDQYLDLLKCRMFRETLLCRAEVALAPEPQPAPVALLHVSSPAKPASAHPDLRPGTVETFQGVRGSGVTTADPFSKAVMLLLSSAWPETRHFPDLLASAAQLAPGDDATSRNLAEILLALYAAGVIELHSEPGLCVSRAGDRPLASELARSQARRGKLITTARHSTIEAGDDQMRQLISLMDGTRDCAALARELGPAIDLPEAALLKSIQDKVALLARAGLLIR